MAHIEAKTEQELLDDWAPLMQGIADTEHAERGHDVRLEAEKHWIEQTNNSRGVDAEGNFPVAREPHSPGVQRFIDAAGGDDDEHDL